MSIAAADPNLPERKLSRFGWILGSLIVHGLLLWAILHWNDNTVIAGKTPQDQMAETTSSDRIEQVIEEVRKREAEQIAGKVEELVDAQKELAKLDAQQLSNYKEVATGLAKAAPTEVQAAQAEAAQAQEMAREAQKAADAAQEKAALAEQESAAAEANAKLPADQRISDAQKEATGAQEAAFKAQKSADAAVARVNEVLPFADQAFRDAAEAQRVAAAAQAEAKVAQQKAIDAQQSAVTDTEKRARAEDEALGSAAVKSATAQAKATEEGTKLGAADAALAAAEGKAGEAQKAAEAARTADDKSGAPAAEQAAQSTARTRDDSKRAEEGEKRMAEEAQRAAAASQKEVEQHTASDKAAREEASKRQGAAQTAQQAADAAEAHAIDLQKQAAALAAKAEAAVASAGEPHSDAVDQAVAQTQVLPVAGDLKSQSMAELYNTATAAEKNATEIYRELRAAETASLRHIALAEARRTTDVVQPMRTPVDTSLLSRKISTPEEARAHSEAIRATMQEIDSMVSLAHDMVHEAKGEEEKGLPVNLTTMETQAKQNAELEREAAQDYGQQAKDLSTLMKSVQQNGNGGAEGHGGAADPVATAETVSLAAMIPMALLQGDPSLGASFLKALAAAAQSSAATSGAGAESGVAGSGEGAGAGQGPAGGGGVAAPEVKGHTLAALPGRKVAPGAAASEWMFVDTWWVLGPFPNPQRKNLEQKFPPESVIDLDATYIGKDNKKVRWDFIQSAHARIWPPDDEEYQIYYAYTELWFEEESDRWIAVGSDDYSKLWIEGMLVWKSGDQLKGWNIDEGLRKVHFKKGLNRVLYRVENGWHSTQFSLCIYLGANKG